MPSHVKSESNAVSDLRASAAGSTSEPSSDLRSHQPGPWKRIQFVAALGIAALGFAYLFLAVPKKSSPENSESRPVPSESVKTIGQHLIQIQGGHVIEKKLQIAKVERTRISVPIQQVTGTIAASLRPGIGQDSNNWQFNTPEALTTFTDWEKAKSDISYSQKRLTTVQELVDAKIAYQKDYEAQVIGAGTKGAISDFTIKKARLETIEAQLDGQKDIYEAENALRLARRSAASLALQLEQTGLEPAILMSATPEMDIVMADVPLGGISYVKIGQECKAAFVGVTGHVFDGKVNKIVPVISKERRSLRVLFVIHDPEDLLRPGMFAEIDMGTEAREALLAPAEGLVHVGRADYFLVAAEKPGTWRVTEVQIGEPFGSDVEVLDGLKAGDRVLGRGAILLKPVVVRSLQANNRAQAEVSP